MSIKEDNEYQKWLAEVKESFPEEVRGAIDQLAGVEATKDLLYRGTLRQKDYYTKLNKLADEKRAVESKAAQLENWYNNEALPQYSEMEEGFKKALKERDQLLAKVKELGLEGEVEVPTKSEIRESKNNASELDALRQRVVAIDNALPAILSEMTRVTHSVISEKWDVDPADVLRHSMEKNIKPTQALEEMVSEQKKAREEEKMEALKKEWMDKGRKDALAKTSGSPDRFRPSGPTVVDNLRKATSASDPVGRVDAAVAQFLELTGGAAPGMGY